MAGPWGSSLPFPSLVLWSLLDINKSPEKRMSPFPVASLLGSRPPAGASADTQVWLPEGQEWARDAQQPEKGRPVRFSLSSFASPTDNLMSKVRSSELLTQSPCQGTGVTDGP